MRSIRMALGLMFLGVASFVAPGCAEDNEARSGITGVANEPVQSKAQQQETYRNQQQQQQQQQQQGYASGGYPGAK